MKISLQKIVVFRHRYGIDFGVIFGWFWEAFGRGLEALGVSGAVFGRPFFVLIIGMLSKKALGGIWAQFWCDFRRFGRNFGGGWEGSGRVLDVKIGIYRRIYADIRIDMQIYAYIHNFRGMRSHQEVWNSF